jgi:pentatricopeptide repeat protein
MNNCEMALNVLKSQIKEPNLNRLNRVMAVSARLGNTKVALGTLNIIKYFGMKPDVISYTSAIHACARGARENVHIAHKLYNEMIEESVQPNHRTYGAIVLAHARLKRWDDVQELMESIPYENEEAKSDVFASAIITCVRNSQYACARQLFLMLLDEGIYPGDKVCNAAISACARISDFDNVSLILRLLKEHASASIYTYNSMISAHSNAKDIDGAINVYRNLRQSAILPDVVTFNALLTACVRARQTYFIPDFLKMMKEEGIYWDTFTLNILLESCTIEKGNVSSALQFICSAEKDYKVRLNRTSYETLMSVFMEAGEFLKVINLWRENYTCRRRAKSSKSLNFLLRACKEIMDINRAVEIVKEFEQRGHEMSSVSYNHFLSVYIACGEVESAVSHLNGMLDKKYMLTTFSFTCITNFLVRNNRCDEALEIFESYVRHRGHGIRSNPLLHYPSDAMYILAARACVSAASPHRALQVYHSCPKSTSMVVRKELAKLAVLACDKTDDWKCAVLLYDSIAGVLDSATDMSIYETVVRIVARAGEFEKALDVNGGDWYRSNRNDKGWLPWQKST